MPRHLASTIGTLALLLLLAAWTRSYAQVWESNPSLWTHAASRAPMKPRPMNFYGLVLVSQGRWAEASKAFKVVAAARHMPRWDQAWLDTGQRNLQSLRALERRYAR